MPLVFACFTGALAAQENDNSPTYLALGDSVAFGLDITLLIPNQPPPPPSAFTGYPEIIAATEHLSPGQEINAACPGETSGSFIKSGVPDYGCNSNGPQGQPPFKTSIGLHTNYPGTQLDFAVSVLTSDTHVKLVTLGIGSNDVLLLIKNCNSAPNPSVCVYTHLFGVLQTYAANLNHILTTIRSTAHYNRDLVLVGTYSPTADLNLVAQALNAVTIAVGARFHMIYADGFGAFERAAAPYGGDVCRAGLLIRLDANTCDIHPSPKGRDLLASTVLTALSHGHH
ncbi:MAG TPA: GDSL-type esterase/lipase family protein [Bryobacteraceae bacterium]|nr:GDSL-type esterase/lipase family protein [Bryobacteraceae bacterium]